MATRLIAANRQAASGDVMASAMDPRDTVLSAFNMPRSAI